MMASERAAAQRQQLSLVWSAPCFVRQSKQCSTCHRVAFTIQPARSLPIRPIDSDICPLADTLFLGLAAGQALRLDSDLHVGCLQTTARPHSDHRRHAHCENDGVALRGRLQCRCGTRCTTVESPAQLDVPPSQRRHLSLAATCRGRAVSGPPFNNTLHDQRILKERYCVPVNKAEVWVTACAV